VIAAAKLPTVTDVPLHFKAVSITLQPDEKSGVPAANGSYRRKLVTAGIGKAAYRGGA
jgi:hypothetical protein